jgi:DNA end-binding protein Ku
MRAIWKGNISFALVTIPINLFSATRKNEISFHYLHKKDMSTVSYKRFCDADNTEVPWEEITKGYEYEKDQYVEITDEDL